MLQKHGSLLSTVIIARDIRLDLKLKPTNISHQKCTNSIIFLVIKRIDLLNILLFLLTYRVYKAIRLLFFSLF
jgi:hypothetical protein